MNMFSALAFLIIGIAVVAIRKQNERKRTLEQMQQIQSAAEAKRKAEDIAHEENRRNALRAWAQCKRDILDLYGLPDACYGPMSLPDLIAKAPWSTMQEDTTHPIYPQDVFMVFLKQRVIYFAPCLIKIDEVDHIEVHRERTNERGEITLHPMAEVNYRPGTKDDPEDLLDMLDLTAFNSADELMEVMRQFPDLKIDFFKSEK